MSETQVPEAWVGLNVEASIVRASYETHSVGITLPKYLTASYRIGKLEAVSSMGIVASLWYDPDDPEEEAPVSTFYPWTSVIWLRPDSPTS